MDGDVPVFLSLVIPAYNEEAGIAQAVEEADDALQGLGVSYEILVVDDGSRDNTAQIVSDARRTRPSIRLISYPINRGYGNALRTGFSKARGTHIAFTDADCQFDLADLSRVLPLTDQHEIAVGYRVDRKDSALRIFYSRGYNCLARALLGTTVRDVDCALKVFRRDALMRILPETKGFFVNSEMLTRARQLGMSIAESGVQHRPRLRGESKVSLHDIPKTLNALLPFWWSRVMFAGVTKHGRDRTSSGLLRFGLLAVLAVMACALFFGPIRQPLLEPEEARYAEIPRQMLAEGRWLTPVFHGEDYYQKPPLLYWLVMGCYQLVGVHDWAARLVPALAGVLTVLLTTAWGWRALGFWTGLLGGAMLALSARFLYMGGMLSMDGLLCFWVISGLAAGHLALRSGSRMPWFVSAAACGLGVLTKGPVALVLVLPPLGALAFLDRRGANPSRGMWAGYGLTVALITGPWFLTTAWLAPQASGDFFWLHNIVRYLAPLDHERPAWFYLPSLVLGALPWTLLIMPLTPYLARRSFRAARRRPASLGFFLLAFGWCVAFFSLSGCKRPAYILPAFPLLALILATFVTYGLPWRRWVASAAPGRAHRLGHRLARRLGRVAVAVAVIVAWSAVVSGLWSSVAAAAATLLAAGSLIVWRRGWRGGAAWRSWAISASVVFVALLAGSQTLLPAYHERFGIRGQVVSEKESFGTELPVACYPRRWDSVSFYLERDVETFAMGQEADLIKGLGDDGQRLLFVKTQALPELRRSLPEGWEFVERGQPGTNVTTGVLRKRS